VRVDENRYEKLKEELITLLKKYDIEKVLGILENDKDTIMITNKDNGLEIRYVSEYKSGYNSKDFAEDDEDYSNW